MSKVAVIGMVGNSAFMRVNQFHRGGETIVADSIHFEPGGKGFNQAVAAARYGAEVSFLGAVGTEYYSEISSFLKDEHIFSVLVRKDESTAFASIVTDAKGRNQVTVYQGALLSDDDVSLFISEIAAADVLLLNNEVPQSVNKLAIKIAKENNTFVILNPAPSVEIDDYILNSVDLFTPNEFEATYLNGQENVIVTLGSKGCKYLATNENFSALQNVRVVDTTGAGDTFNGVLACFLAESKDISLAIPSAIAASGVSVTKKYASTSIPTKNEVEEFLNKN